MENANLRVWVESRGGREKWYAACTYRRKRYTLSGSSRTVALSRLERRLNVVAGHPVYLANF